MKMSNIYFQRQKFKKPEWMIMHWGIVGRCNLNCVSCNAFAPIAGDYVLAVDSFESDCKRLSELGGEKIPEIHFVGGEPLLHPRLVELLGIARSYFPRAKLKIVTNGTLLLKQDEAFWECCGSNGVDIIISHYPIKLDIKAVRAMMKKYGLSLRYYRGVLPWYKMALDLSGGHGPRENYKRCLQALQCIELRDGRVSTCQLIQKVRYFNSYFQTNLEVLDSDTIDIHKVESMDEILEFVANPVQFCRYCEVEWIPVKWGASKKEISEWT